MATKKKKKDKELEQIISGSYNPFPSNNNTTTPRVADFSGGTTTGKVNTRAELTSNKKDTGYFTKGAFGDDEGNIFTDAISSILGTSNDIVQDIIQVPIGLGEKAIDIGATGIGFVADKIGQDDFANKMKDFVAKDIIDEEGISNRIVNTGTTFGIINNLFNGDIENLNPFSKDSMSGETTENNSLFGTEADGLVQSASLLGVSALLQGVGVPWQVTMGASAFGSEAENAFKNDATYNEAVFSSTVSAGAEILFGSLFKIPGVSASGSGKFGSKVIEKLGLDLSNVATRNMVNWGVNLVGEGGEEVATSFIQRLGQALSYEREETIEELINNEEARESYVTQLGEKLFGEEARDEYGKSFISGMALSGIVGTPQTISATKKGRDIVTGNTEVEQKVVDEVVEKRKQELLSTKGEGETLTNKEIKKIQEEVQEDFENGRIDVKDIESIVGEDVVNEWNSKRTQLQGLQQEFKTATDETTKQEISKQIRALEGEINSNSRIQRSYAEKQKKSTEFTYKVTGKESEYAKGVIESTKGIVNDTTHSHEMANALIKMSDDRGMQYKFTNNKQLQEKGIVPKGKIANGIYEIEVDGKREILVNVDSKKYLEAVLVHETAHDLKTTNAELFNNLSKATVEYAKAKGDYDTISQEINEMYEGVDNANVDEEITARLLEDYLGNKEFISDLSTKEPGIVKKIIDEIKYLYKKFTASSPEARKLLELQRNMEDAYKKAYRSTEVKGDANARTNLEVEKQVEIKKEQTKAVDSKGNELSIEQQNKFNGTKVLDENGNLLVMYHGTGNDFNTFDINKSGQNYEDGWSAYGSGFYFTADEQGAKTYAEETEGTNQHVKAVYLDVKKPFYANENHPELFERYGLELSPNVTGRDFITQLNNRDGRDASTRALKELGYDGIIEDFGEKAIDEVVVFDSSQIKNVDNTKPTDSPDIRYSLSDAPVQDNQGRELSIQQQEFFKDSKVRDEEGNLLTVYHGTGETFTKFEKEMIGSNFYQDSQGFFFTDDIKQAEDYANTTSYGMPRENPGNVMETYLNITNPLIENIDFDPISHWDENYERLIEKANKNGNDGVIIKAQKYQSMYVAFEPNQIKNIDNTNPTSDADIRYSLSDAGTTGTLMAVHNLDESKMLGVIELGGLPSPSIAIINSEIGIQEGFGGISALFDKNTIDPSNPQNEVYDRDVHSPRFPFVSNKFSNNTKEIAKKLGLEDYEISHYLDNKTIEEATRVISNNIEVINKYLTDNNIKIDDVYINKEIKTSYNNDSSIQEFVKNNDITYEKLVNKKELREEYLKLIKEYQDKSVMKLRYEEVLREQLETDEKNGIDNGSRYIQILNEDFKLIKNPIQEYDKVATNNAKRDYVQNDSNYKKYIRSELEKINEGKYIEISADDYLNPDGSRKSFNQLHKKFTLENVVEEMINKDTIATEGVGVSFGTLNASSSTKFNSIEEIRNSKDRIVERKSEGENLKEIEDKIYEDIRTIAKTNDSYKPDEYISLTNSDIEDAVITSFMEVARKNDYSINNLKKQLEKNYLKPSKLSNEQLEKTLQDLKNLKNASTEYFEAKPQRAVKLDEIEALVIPNNSSKEFKQTLQENGIKYYEYDPNIKGDRLRVINEFDNLKFSLSNQNEADVVSTNNRTASSDIRLQIEELITPLQETIVDLTNEVKTLQQAQEVKALTEDDIPFIEQMNTNVSDEAPVRNNLTTQESNELDYLEAVEDGLDAEQQQRLAELRDKEAFVYNEEISPIKSLFETRDYAEVGNQKIKAYQYENPEVKPYFKEEALMMLHDLNNSTKGERMITGDISQLGNNDYEYTGTKRHTTLEIEQLLDGVDGKLKLSYDEIRKGLNALIEDNGLENNKASKRIEFFIDQRLREGYEDIEGNYYPPNQEYINMLKEKGITEYNQEAYDNWLATLDDNVIDEIITNENASNTEVLEGNVQETNKKHIPQDPTKESTYENSIKKDPALEAIEQASKELVARVNDKTNVQKTQTPKVQKTKFKNLVDTTRTLFVNKFNEVDNLAKDTGNRTLTFKADMLNSVAGEIEGDINVAQTNNNGVKVGKSVRDLFKPSKDAGLYDAFNDYLIQKSNIERHKQNKGSVVPEKVSRQLVQDYEQTYPQMKEWAKDVYKYYDNVLNNEVEAGLVKPELAKLLRGETMYPSYVPFFPNEVDTNRYFDNGGELKPVSVLKRAKGKAHDIAYIEDSMIKQTYAYKSAVRKNNLYKEIVNTLEKRGLRHDIGGDARQDPTQLNESLYIDTDGTRYLTAYVNGETKSVKISEDLYNSLENGLGEQIKELEQKYSLVTKPLQKLSEIRRNLLTTWSPSFLITNPIKDIQDAVFNSKYTKDMLKNYLPAYKELSQKNNPTVQQFLALYGDSSSYGEFDADSVNKTSKLKNVKMLQRLSAINNVIELAPRYAEFKASLQNGVSVEEAIYNARDITTNFSRGGEITKAMNRNGFTFLNASVQGFDKLYRNFSGENGAKGYAQVLSKAVMYGVLPALLNALLFDDDEEYEVLPDYIKDNYYLFKTGEGEFIRIPKGRVISVFGSAGRRTLEFVQGEEDAFEGYLKNAYSQVGVSNPLESNIFAPLIQAYGSEAGTTWYGEDLVPSRLQDLPSEEQYDASTDKVSQVLGDLFNISPYKLNYVIDQYTGGIGDLILPTITEEASSDGSLLAPLVDKFTANSTTDNKNVGDIYSLSEELSKKSNSSKATDEDTLRSKYIYSVTSEMNKLYAERREIQNDDTLTKAEKYEKSQAIKEQINSLAKEGLENYQNINKTSNYAIINDREYYKYYDEKEKEYKWGTPYEDELKEINSLGMDIDEKSSYFSAKDTISTIKNEYKDVIKNADDEEKTELYAEQKLKIIEEVKKANLIDEQKAYLYNKYYSSEETLEVVTKTGIDFNAFLDYEAQSFTADKNIYGETISGSKKTKVFNYINSMDLDFEQKVILAKMEYNSYDEYNVEIIEYLNNDSSITYEDMESILKKLGFKVDEYGNIYW